MTEATMETRSYPALNSLDFGQISSFGQVLINAGAFGGDITKLQRYYTEPSLVQAAYEFWLGLLDGSGVAMHPMASGQDGWDTFASYIESNPLS